MKIILVGASGDIGSVVNNELGKRHDIITVGRSSGDIIANMSDASSVKAMFEKNWQG
jgi:putative NADH-flavin reductase